MWYSSPTLAVFSTTRGASLLDEPENIGAVAAHREWSICGTQSDLNGLVDAPCGSG